MAGELAARRGDRFEDDLGAIRGLARDPRFPAEIVRPLERLPGFRIVLVHEHVAFDLGRAAEALEELEPIERFVEIVRSVESGPAGGER